MRQATYYCNLRCILNQKLTKKSRAAAMFTNITTQKNSEQKLTISTAVFLFKASFLTQMHQS